MLHQFFSFLLFVFAISLSGCKANKPSVESHPSTQYIFLDSTEAAAFITHDKSEGFFDNIQQLDMSIQLGKECIDRDACLKAYISQLQGEVLPFTESDKKLMTEVMDSALTLVNLLNKNLVKKTIRLIKIKGLHYGPSVYYTREEGIVIPADVLEDPNFSNLLATTLHEIAHIVSRYEGDYKEKLYPLIGFLNTPGDLEIPQSLKKKQLLNPDGLNDSYRIILTNGDEKIEVIPLIISNLSYLSENKDGFFEYIKFDLYECHGGKVVCDENGFSTMNPAFMVSFFEQIKDNTQYIIHPDEILADNFMYLCLAKGDLTDQKFSTEGIQLLKEIKLALQEI